MLRRLIKGLTDIVYPKICLSCRDKLDISSIERLVCASCWDKIDRNLPPFCHSCGRQLEKKNFNKSICPACLKKQLHFDRAYSPCKYSGALKELIHQFKYNGKDYLGRPLSKLMIDFIKEYSLPMEYIDLVIPMPLHEAKLRQREFNQAEVLSRQVGISFNKDMHKDILKRSRLTKTQTELESSLRHENVKNSFSVTKHEMIKGKNILLVDDVLTSGATSSEAARCLKEAGSNIVLVLTLAN